MGELALLSTVGWSPLRVASLIFGEGIVLSTSAPRSACCSELSAAASW